MKVFIIILALLLPSAAWSANWDEWKQGPNSTDRTCKTIPSSSQAGSARCFWFFDTLTAGNESPVLNIGMEARCAVRFDGTSGTIHPYYCDKGGPIASCERAHYWNGATGAFEDVELTQNSRKLDYYGERTLLINPEAGTGIVVIECGGR